MRKIILLFSILSLIMAMTSCSSQKEDLGKAKLSGYPFEILESEENVLATIEMENGDKIELELYPKIAPISVSNFKYLAEKGFYNGLTFHRVIEGFMIQGGCPKGDGTGDPGYKIKGEFSSNGVKNDLKHERGVISMARSQMPDSAGSQFFIMHKTSTHLDGEYAAFGRVTSGMEIVDKIVQTPVDENDKPLNPVVIKAITIK